MAEEVGIVMTLYDRVSPTLKSIAGSNKAFDKSLDELEASLKAYDKAQTELVGRSANLKKAIAETDVKVREAQKSYRKLKDETSKGALDDAIDEQARLRRELSDTETAIKENSAAYQELYKQARNAASAISKVDNRAGAGGGADGSGASMLAALGKAGLLQMAGDAAQEVANTLIGSAFGDDAGGILSSGLSGAISGAAIGSIVPGLGTAVGAAIGGALGLITGGAQAFQNKDEAFKSYVQEAAEGQLSAQEEAVASGSSIAGGREQKQMAFTTLLGSEEAAAAFLADVQDMAAMTNYT